MDTACRRNSTASFGANSGEMSQRSVWETSIQVSIRAVRVIIIVDGDPKPAERKFQSSHDGGMANERGYRAFSTSSMKRREGSSSFGSFAIGSSERTRSQCAGRIRHCYVRIYSWILLRSLYRRGTGAQGCRCQTVKKLGT